MRYVPSFSIGQEVTNEQLYSEFSCANMGGMRRSKATNSLILISDHTKSFYDDKWYGSELHYTGMGKKGDQVLTGNQNLTLAESGSNGVSVFLFEVFKAGRYVYQGEVQLSGKPYRKTQPDVDGELRNVWIFPLKTKGSVALTQKELEEYRHDQVEKVKQLSPEELKQKAINRGAEKGSSRTVTSNVYVRDEFIAAQTKANAHGFCELCEKPAPFNDKDGNPYLESHHVIWLSRGGADKLSNTVALCPNCHKKMHIVDDEKDIAKLSTIAKNR